MDLNGLRKALESEHSMKVDQVENALKSCERLIEEMRGGRSLNHGAHNLAARAQELAVLSGEIEQIEKTVRSIQ